MADLLTHILVPYIILTVASWWIYRIDKAWIVIGMTGAVIPDIVKIRVFVDSSIIQSIIGLPFTYAPISSLGGVLLISGVIAVFFEQKRQAYGFLIFGGISALLVDGLRVFADGHSNFWLYPLSWWRPPTPSLYVTSDARVVIVALIVSASIFIIDWKYK